MAELNLFTQYDRDARQKLSLEKWIKSNMKGTLEAATGYGKTRVALNAIKLLLKHYSTYRFLIVVPTENLKTQWEQQIDTLGFGLSCEVMVINTVIKHNWQCNVLILDEVHRAAADTLKQVFNKVNYKYILGLTATFERLDGKHELIAKYCPVIDTITVEEALLNGWVSKFTEYEVLIDVPDIEIYKSYNKEFSEHFEFFNWNFQEAMACLGPNGYKQRIAIRDRIAPRNASKAELSAILKNVMYHSMGFIRTIQARKKFINNHAKKLEIARKIIKARPNSKIITFSNNVKMAESIGIGEVYTGKLTKKRGRTTIEDFNNKPAPAVINSCAKLNEGADLKGLSVGIILGIDSSSTKSTQRLGRVIRWEENKTAEVFNIIINNTVETEWFDKSHKDRQYTIIDEKNLDKVLNFESIETYKKPIQKFMFRF